MELSLISLVSLLVVCSAVLIRNKAMIKRRVTSIAPSLRSLLAGAGAITFGLVFATPTFAQSHQGGEASLELPDLSQVTFLNGITGHNLLLVGILISVLGLAFGLVIYMQLQRLPVHKAMK